jgi:hypothetical protein
MTAARTAIQDFSTTNAAYANATVTVYKVDGLGKKTATKSDLYATLTGAVKLANPVTLDSYGKFKQPVYVENDVILTVTGLKNTPDHDTGVVNGNFESGAAINVFYSQDGIGAQIRTVQDKIKETISVKDFGVVGNGSALDALKIQLAINALELNGGGTLFFPPGVYNIDAPVYNKSKVNIKGSGLGSCQLNVNNGYTATAFGGSGTADSPVNLVGNYNTGKSVFITQTSHNLAVGNFVHFIGQRNSLSADTDNESRLGYGTPGSPECYFGEFLQVKKIISPTSFETYGGLIFSNYNDNNTLDPLSSRVRSTIQKITFLENIKISDLTIKVLGNQNGALRFKYGRKIELNNVDVISNNNMGAAVFFEDCLDSFGYNCYSEYGPDIDLINNKANYNSFKTAGSQLCSFIFCRAKNSSQGVDFTYFNGKTPSIFCKVTISEMIDSQITGLTSHGGTYAISFIGNTIPNARQGISCRSRNSIISNNNISYFGEYNPSDETHYGIGLFEGWARDCTISNNTIDGFHSGISIVDGADAGETFGYVGCAISGNTITNSKIGFYVNPSNTNTKSELRHIKFNNNILKNCFTRFVFVDGPAPGVFIDDNIMNRLISGSEGIRFAANSHPFSKIRNNEISNVGLGVTGIRIDAESGFTFGYATNFTCVLSGNTFSGAVGTQLSASSTLLDPLNGAQVPGRLGSMIISDGIAAPTQINNYAIIYVDSADGDLKVKFGDGVTKTIATDT